MAILNISGTINSSFSTSGVLVNAAQAAGDAVFTIDLRPTNPIIIVQDNLDYGVLAWDINDAVAVITLVGPLGDVYRNDDYNAPDIVPATSRYLNKTVTLPLDPLTNYTNILKGNYTLKISWYNATLDEYYTFLKTYQYNMDPATIANTTVSGPYTGVLKSTDTTVYGADVHQIIREHRIQYPTQLAVPPADIVSSNAEVQVTPIYTNEWNIIISSFVEYRMSDTLRVYWEGSGEFTHCVFGGCIGAMYDAINTMLITYMDAMACNLNNQEAYQKRLVTINTAWHLLNEAYWTGDTEEADNQSYVIQEMVEYSGGGVCGGATSVLVTPCPPWTGGGVGGTYTFSNALVEAAGNVTWGGSLVQATTVLMVGYEVLFSGSDLGNTVSQSISASGGILQKSSDGTTEGRVYATVATVTLEVADLVTPANTRGYEITASGLLEKADYSAGYVNTSLVNKLYVDTLFSGAATYTFENGLTETGGTVRLGSPIAEASTIHFNEWCVLNMPQPYQYIFTVDGTSPGTSFTKFVQGYSAAWITSGNDQEALADAWHEISVKPTSIKFGYFTTNPSSLRSNIEIFPTSMVVKDEVNLTGLQYNADYSTAGVANDRWIPDYAAVKAYADSISGVTVFTSLTDTPSSYTGFSEYFVRVNTAETALEFVAAAFVPATGGTFTGQVTIATATDRPLILKQIGAGSVPGTPEAGINYLSFQDNDGDEQGYIGIDASGNIILNSSITGGGILANDSLTVQGNVTASGTLSVDTIGEVSVGNGVVVDGVVLKDNEMSLDYLGSPTANKVLAMSVYQWKMIWTAPTTLDGAFELEATGNFSGDLLHLHQHTGSPVALDTHLVHMEGESANVDLIKMTHTVSANHAFQVSVAADANFRFTMDMTGLMSWGDGTLASDTTLYRSAAGVLKTDGNLSVAGSVIADTITEYTGTAGVTFLDEVYFTGITAGTDVNLLYYDSGTGEVKWGAVGNAVAPFGTKATSVDAGALGEFSVDDDYLYVCVVAGGIGVAIWKRVALSQT